MGTIQMLLKKLNIWYVSSFAISLVVSIPILTVFSSFFDTTGNYSTILKDTYLTIGDQLDDGSWTFSLQINYFIKWIWFSSALMVIGILMTIFKKKIS